MRLCTTIVSRPRLDPSRIETSRPPANQRSDAAFGLDVISGRYKLFCRVTEISVEGLLAEVEIDIGSGHQVVSIITAGSARNLRLKVGSRVDALVKATEVMVIKG